MLLWYLIICNADNINIIISDCLTGRLAYWLIFAVWFAQFYTKSRNGRVGEDNELQLGADSWTATFLMQEDTKCTLLYCRHSYLYFLLFGFLTGEVPNAKLLIREFSSQRRHTFTPHNKRRCHTEQPVAGLMLRVCTSYTHKWSKMLWCCFDLVTGESVFFTFHSQFVWKREHVCLYDNKINLPLVSRRMLSSPGWFVAFTHESKCG